MRDAIGRFGGLDKEFAHTSNLIPGHVVSFSAHQFRRVNIHTPSLLRVSGLSQAASLPNLSRQQKTRVPKNLGRGQVPHTNGLTFSCQSSLPTRPLALWLAPRATTSGHPA